MRRIFTGRRGIININEIAVIFALFFIALILYALFIFAQQNMEKRLDQGTLSSTFSSNIGNTFLQAYLTTSLNSSPDVYGLSSLPSVDATVSEELPKILDDKNCLLWLQQEWAKKQNALKNLNTNSKPSSNPPTTPSNPSTPSSSNSQAKESPSKSPSTPQTSLQPTPKSTPKSSATTKIPSQESSSSTQCSAFFERTNLFLRSVCDDEYGEIVISRAGSVAGSQSIKLSLGAWPEPFYPEEMINKFDKVAFNYDDTSMDYPTSVDEFSNQLPIQFKDETFSFIQGKEFLASQDGPITVQLACVEKYGVRPR